MYCDRVKAIKICFNSLVHNLNIYFNTINLTYDNNCKHQFPLTSLILWCSLIVLFYCVFFGNRLVNEFHTPKSITDSFYRHKLYSDEKCWQKKRKIHCDNKVNRFWGKILNIFESCWEWNCVVWNIRIFQSNKFIVRMIVIMLCKTL